MKNLKVLFPVLILSILVNGFFIFDNINFKEKEVTNSGSIVEEEIEKRDFLVNVKKISDFDNIAILSKIGKLSTTQDISLNSNVNGRVMNVYVKEGDIVYENQVLAMLDDNISNYGLNLEIAKNNLEKAKLNYESTENQLNKSIEDIKRDLNDSFVSTDGSSSSLELMKIENTINQLNIDYKNLQITNIETKDGFRNSLGKDLIILEGFLDDVIDFSDSILGITDTNKKYNDDFDQFLGIRDRVQKNESKILLKELIEYRESYLTNLSISINEDSDFDRYVYEISNGYVKIDNMLAGLDLTLDNTVASVGSISDSEISTYKSKISTYQSTYNSYNSTFVSLSNSISSFLKTYINSEESVLKQIENLESDKKIYVKSLDLKVDSFDSTLEEAEKNKEITLRNLEILITDSEIGYKQALKEYNKLTIKSPINGIIESINIDEGQEVFSGNKLFGILNDGANEIIISFNKDELDFIEKGTNVFYNDGENTFTGSIYSISKNADENLKYLSRVSFPEGVSYIGNIINLEIPVMLENKLLPLNILKINNSGLATINYISESGELEQYDFKVGNIYDDKIEVLGVIDNQINIILDFIDNFDPDKFILKINK